jgi:hypothetical protein
MKLGAKQECFSKSLAKLLNHAASLGYGIRLRELMRSKEQAELYALQGKGVKNSVHRHSLAIDLYITVEGELKWDGLEYEMLGFFWSKLSIPELEHCWGGNFRRRDVYHYSIKHNGVM